MELYVLDPSAQPLAQRVLGRASLIYPHADGRPRVSSYSAQWLRSPSHAGRHASRLASHLRAVNVSAAELDEARDRLIVGWAAGVSDPLPEPVREELYTRLLTDPSLRLEYMGRGPFARRDPSSPGNAQMFSCDIAGGRRHYYVRHVARDEVRLQALEDTMKEFRAWLNDEDAKLVVSIGGGGLRMFAATTLLKSIERLLDGDRRRVAEVWGSSGGAFVGHVFASGLDLDELDALGFDMHHNRDHSMVNGTLSSLLRRRAQEAYAAWRRRPLETATGQWMRALEERRAPPDAPGPLTSIPFYSVATNPRRGGLCALAEPHDIPDHCRDIIIPCERHLAVSASTAVPFLFQAQRGIDSPEPEDTEPKSDRWVDGSLTEENPLLLPYIKWSRERRHAPQSTAPRLKLLLIDLNLRSSESALLRSLRRIPLLRKIAPLASIARLVDVVLDSRTHGTLQLLGENPDVSVRSLKLNLGSLSFNDPREIPYIIGRGRQREAWQIQTYSRGL